MSKFRGIGPAGMRLAALSGASSVVESIYADTVTVSGTLTATKTIPRVDLTRATVRILGLSTTDSGATLARHFTRIELTNETTVTVTRTDATTTDIISFQVMQRRAGLVRVQRGTITLGGTSVTSTLSFPVNPGKTDLFWLGQDTTATTFDAASVKIALTADGTGVVATRNTNTGTSIIGFELEEWL